MNSLLLTSIFFLVFGFDQLAGIQFNETLLTSGNLEQVCGIPAFSEARIQGGTDANPEEWPWMAMLSIYFSTKQIHCRGTLISNEFILTAAHCIVHYKTNELATKGFVYLGPLHSSSISYKVKKFIPYEKLAKRFYKFDIALIQLDTKVVFSKLTLPACLPESADLINSDYVGRIAVLIGYKKPGNAINNELQQLNVEVVSEKDCKTKLFSKDHVCGQGLNAGGACWGDSGGPLMLRNTKGQENVIGIVSLLQRQCLLPSLFTRVASYLDWIKKNAGMN